MLWLAGLMAVSVFVLLTPYVLLDFASFETYFSAQVANWSGVAVGI